MASNWQKRWSQRWQKRAFVVLSAFAWLVGMAACSSEQKKAGDAAAEPPPGSIEAVLDKFSFRRLSQAESALRAVRDAGPEIEGNPGETLLGCSISKAQAQTWLRLLRPLIQKQALQERDSYEIAPRAYSSQFTTCAPSCLCGAYAELIADSSPAREEDRKFHRDALSKLQRKASVISSPALASCAREQGWFCASDLKAYLEKSAPGAR